MFKAAAKIGLDTMIMHEINRLINGEREGFKKDFKDWLDGLLEGAVPKAWGDDIVKFLKKARNEI